MANYLISWEINHWYNHEINNIYWLFGKDGYMVYWWLELKSPTIYWVMFWHLLGNVLILGELALKMAAIIALLENLENLTHWAISERRVSWETRYYKMHIRWGYFICLILPSLYNLIHQAAHQFINLSLTFYRNLRSWEKMQFMTLHF